MKINRIREILSVLKFPCATWIVGSFVVFPFINTTTGMNIFIFGTRIWKLMAVAWFLYILLSVVLYKSKLLQRVTKWEVLVWVFLAVMIVLRPVDNFIIDPHKSAFFSITVAVYIRAMLIMTSEQIKSTLLITMSIWASFVSIFLGYVLYNGGYPGSNQHQFFISGTLGFFFMLHIIVWVKDGDYADRLWRRDFSSVFLLILAITNFLVNTFITRSRSVFLFGIILICFGLVMVFYANTTRKKPKWVVMVVLSLTISFLPIIHLSGYMGNILYDLTDPIFKKKRYVHAETGREVAFQKWIGYLEEEWTWIVFKPDKVSEISSNHETKAERQANKSDNPEQSNKPDSIKGDNPQQSNKPDSIKGDDQQQLTVVENDNNQQKHDNSTINIDKPEIKQISSDILPLSDKDQMELNNVQRYANRKMWSIFGDAPKSNPISQDLAITSSHNLWLDAAYRAGLLYALITLGCLITILILVCKILPRVLPWSFIINLWLLLVSWGIASQLDDEHWLYHIPFLTFFFIGIISLAIITSDSFKDRSDSNLKNY